MNVILLEKIGNLGDLGDEVSVKPGFARNYLFLRESCNCRRENRTVLKAGALNSRHLQTKN
ncbi:MAG: hypothetical protein Ct9H90mP27_4590 [Gammaproteobacteria bacterium]|nr:MAG: hypothetical protein Ct9H90mP27_4590 [Gammaproteobacteria bacterium]